MPLRYSACLDAINGPSVLYSLCNCYKQLALPTVRLVGASLYNHRTSKAGAVSVAGFAARTANSVVNMGVVDTQTDKQTERQLTGRR